jgi:hypothetical protein
MSQESTVFAAVTIFLAINFYLVWISRSLIFAFHTSKILIKVATFILAFCLLVSSLDYAELEMVGLIICVQLLIASWLNVKIAVFSLLGRSAFSHVLPSSVGNNSERN